MSLAVLSLQLLDFPRLDGAEAARDLLRVAVILALAWLGYRLLRTLTRRIERAGAGPDPGRLSEAEQRGRTLAALMQSVGVAVIVTTAGLLILDAFIDVTPLLAGVGIVGLGLSFGAQSLVRDVIAGFFMLLEDQFRVAT